MSAPSSLLTLPAALLLDRLAGDPDWLWRRLPHPVAAFGWAIDRLEAALNQPSRSFGNRRRRGVLAMAILVVAGGALGSWLHLALPYGAVGLAVEAVIAAVLLAQKSLVDHVAAVAAALEGEGETGGRAAVAKIVGRDVSALDEAGVARAAIESAAENFSDGVIAPAFWFALLGLPGLIVFKIVNTADSMIGHRSPRYEAFGWAAARLDDAANFVPARLAAALIAAAATIAGGDGAAAIGAALRDASRHKSPNAGWPEAAMAGALDLALGGPRRYGDRSVDGAWLNPNGRREIGAAEIRATLRLIDRAWGLLLAISVLAAAITLLLAQ